MQLLQYQDININAIIACLQQAGEGIMSFYHNSYTVDTKSDESPVTEADVLSNDIITRFLEKNYLTIPIISEESSAPDYDIRKSWDRVWILDPLDGTKEFIKKTDHFCINLALIENGKPTLGFIYLPVTGEVFYGANGHGAFCKNGSDTHQITVHDFDINSSGLRVPISKSHLDDLTLAQINTLDNPCLMPLGSALKFIYIADGLADYYPRMINIMEWDVAAGHAIIDAAGGTIVDFNTRKPLTYNKPSLQNPFFIAMGHSIS